MQIFTIILFFGLPYAFAITGGILYHIDCIKSLYSKFKEKKQNKN